MATVEEARDALRQLDFPDRQQNRMAALTLLALLGLRPGDGWGEAGNRPRGVTPMMEFFDEHYEVRYAANTRETVRRHAVHQFLDAALIEANPDRPDRPTNSGKTVYRIAPEALELLRSYGTPRWPALLRRYRKARPSLREMYAGARMARRVPLSTPRGPVGLSPGRHSELVRAVCDEFAPRFVPGGTLLYAGDTADKSAYVDGEGLGRLGVRPPGRGKMPDVILHHARRGWLVLAEAVTSHGPVDPKRHGELRRMFSGSRAGLVYVTAFHDRASMRKYVAEISWETEVWVAESPDHLIHFDGDRFLGPRGRPGRRGAAPRGRRRA